MKILIHVFFLLVVTKMANGQYQKDMTDTLILKRLETYHSGATESLHTLDFLNQKNITDTIRKKLFSLLQNKWTEAELRPWVEYYMLKYPDDFEFRFWQRGLMDSIKFYSMNMRVHFDSAYHYWYDSLKVVFKNDTEKKIKARKVPDELVVGAGIINLREAIPILRDDLFKTSEKKFNSKAAELSLAIMGDTFFQHKFEKLHYNYIADPASWGPSIMYKDYDAALFINDQHFVSLMADWMDTTKIYNGVSDGPPEYFYSSGHLVNRIVGLILNKDFLEGFNKQPQNEYYKSGSKSYDVTKEQIMFIKNWLIENKGKYELRR